MTEPTNAAALGEAVKALSNCHASLRDRILARLDGGAGSGNWGHAGRPGARGGSAPGGGKMHRVTLEDGSYTSVAKRRKEAKRGGEKSGRKSTGKAGKYGAIREEVRKTWEPLSEAIVWASMAKDRVDIAQRYGQMDLKAELQKYEAWEAKKKELLPQYMAAVKKAGLTTETERVLYRSDIDYNPVAKLETPRSEAEIIKTISGGDETKGSCVSAALAYIGQKKGLDVLDFRGGESMEFFRQRKNHMGMLRDCGVKPIIMDTAFTADENGKRLLAQMEEGKQYCFSTGRHTSIVRIHNGRPQYLELQDRVGSRNGWHNFNRDVRSTLKKRFQTSESWDASEACAVDIDEISGDHFGELLGYINTNVNEQRKGSKGSVR